MKNQKGQEKNPQHKHEQTKPTTDVKRHQEDKLGGFINTGGGQWGMTARTDFFIYS